MGPWHQVGWMLTHHRDCLDQAFRMILDSLVPLRAGIQSTRDWVPETPGFESSWDAWVRILLRRLGSNPGHVTGKQLYSLGFKITSLHLCTLTNPMNDAHDSCLVTFCYDYRQVSNIRRTLEGNKIIDHSDVVGASPVSAAPTTFSFST